MTAWFDAQDELFAWLTPAVSSDLALRVNAASGQDVGLCYHCHKCTSGCPVSADMTFGPDRVLRLVQLGEQKRLLESRDIWLCAGCETCAQRCPNGIDIARVMDSLRHLAIRESGPLGEPDAVKFHRLFLAVVRTLGRMHEAVLLGAYKVWSGHLLADLDSGAAMIAKAKIPIWPRRVEGMRQIRRAFTQAGPDGLPAEDGQGTRSHRP